MPSPGKLIIITPIMVLIGTALYVTILTIPSLSSMFQVEITSTYVTWQQSSQQYKYRTIYGIEEILLSNYWEIVITIKNEGVIETSITEITINNQLIGEPIVCLSKKADEKVYDTYKIKLSPGESVKIVILIPFNTSGTKDFRHGQIVEVKIRLKARELTTVIVLP